MQIEWINHASFVVNSGSVRLATDPWLFGKVFNESWELLVPSKFTTDDFDGVTHIWLSHEHPDHFSPPVLSQIPEKTRKQIRVLFQETKDRRVVNLCRKLGFSVTELPDGKGVDIAPDFRVTCGKVPFADSWLAIEAEGKCLLNLNDCVITRPAVIRGLNRRFGKVDVLFQQFSYASWVANEDQQEAWKSFAKQTSEIILSHTANMRPHYIVPFASFVRFCHTENQYMNRHVNRVGEITRRLEQQGIATPIVLFPGDKWSPGEPRDNAAALARYAEADVAPFTPGKSQSVSFTELKALADSYRDRMLGTHSRALVMTASAVGFMPPISFQITDLQKTFSFDWANGLRPCETSAPDITLHSDSLAYVFRFDWGLDTLFVNGRFHSGRRGLNKLLRTLALGSLNNIGKRFGPKLILDLNLLRSLYGTPT